MQGCRVLIAVPTFENITPDTYKALWDMDKPCECAFEFVRGYDCASARNKIAQRALDGGYSHVLMVDSDVTLPRDALVNLLSHGERVVIGFYMHRDKDTNAITERTCACRLADESGKPYFGYPSDSEWTASELRDKREAGEYLLAIHGGGMGCVLIKTDVFDELRYPWFEWRIFPGDIGMLSEDLCFCENLKNEGIPIYADTRVACGHLMRRIEHVL